MTLLCCDKADLSRWQLVSQLMWGLYLIFLLFITYYIQILINPLQEIWSALSVPYLTTIQPNGSLKWGLCLICIFLIYIYIFKYFINPLSEIWGCLKTGVQHSSRKSSTTHSYHCVQYFCVAKQWYSCQCFGIVFNMCTDVATSDHTQGSVQTLEDKRVFIEI